MAEYVISLIDDVSGKAKNVAKSIGNVMRTIFQAESVSAGFQDVFSSLTKSMDPYTLAVEAAVVATSALAIGVAVLGTTAYSSAREHQSLVSQFDAISGNGEKMTEMLDTLSESLPYTDDELVDFAKNLAKAGFSLDKVKNLTQAAAGVMAMSTKEAATKFVNEITKIQRKVDEGKNLDYGNFAKSLQAAGVSAQDLGKSLGMSGAPIDEIINKFNNLNGQEKIDLVADTINNKAKPALEQLNSSLGVITEKIKDAWGDIFKKENTGDLDKSFIAAKDAVIQLLTALAPFLTGAAEVIFDLLSIAIFAVVDAVNYTAAGFYLLNAAINKVFGAKKKMEMLNTALQALKITAIILAVIFGILALIVVASMMLILLPILLVVAAIFLIAFAVLSVINIIKSLAANLSSIWEFAKAQIMSFVATVMSVGGALFAAGADIVQGLINGISSKLANLQTKASELGNIVKNAVTGKGALDINSPSRVMMDIGGYVGDGLAIGMEAATPNVSDSAASMAQSVISPVDKMSGNTGNNTQTTNNNNKNITFNITIANADNTNLDDFKSKLEQILKQSVIELGIA